MERAIIKQCGACSDKGEQAGGKECLGPVIGPLVQVREADVLLFDWFTVAMVPEWIFARVLVYRSLTLLATL